MNIRRPTTSNTQSSTQSAVSHDQTTRWDDVLPRTLDDHRPEMFCSTSASSSFLYQRAMAAKNPASAITCTSSQLSSSTCEKKKKEEARIEAVNEKDKAEGTVFIRQDTSTISSRQGVCRACHSHMPIVSFDCSRVTMTSTRPKEEDKEKECQ